MNPLPLQIEHSRSGISCVSPSIARAEQDGAANELESSRIWALNFFIMAFCASEYGWLAALIDDLSR